MMAFLSSSDFKLKLSDSEFVNYQSMNITRIEFNHLIQDLVSKMTIEEKVGFMLISTSRLAGDFSFQQNALKAEITSGFNEEDLVQNMNMFSKKPLPYPMLSAAGTTKGITKNHLRHFILRANTSAKILAEWASIWNILFSILMLWTFIQY